MQNKINLDTHNEVIPVSEPWHRGSGFTWMLLAIAGAVFFLSGAVAKAQTTYTTGTGNWNTGSRQGNAGEYSVNNGVGIWSADGNVGWGIVDWRNFTADGTLNGAQQDLRVGQSVTIRMAGANSGSPGRTGVVNNGAIGFALASSSGAPSTSPSNTADQALDNTRFRVEFVGGANSVTAVGSATDSTGLPGFNDFKNGQTYTIERVSLDEINFKVAGGATYNLSNLGGTAGSGIGSIRIYNRGSNMNAEFTDLSVANMASVTLTKNNGETATITGEITKNGSSNNNVVKNGDGTVVLSAANTYGGTTTVENGILRAANNGALSTGAVTVNSGGTLEMTANVSNETTLNGTGEGGVGALRNLSGNNTHSGAVTLGSNSSIKSEAGSMTLTGGITGTGATLTVNGSGSTTISTSGLNTGTGGALTKNDSGTLFLSADGSYTGATTINGGVVEIQNATALGTTAAGTTVASGAQLKLYNAGSMTVAEAITLNGTGGDAGALRNVGGDNTVSGNITLASNSRINSSSAGSLAISGAVDGGANVLYLGGSRNMSISGAISGGGASQDGTTTSLFKDGAGELTLTGNNSYSGDTRITTGALTVNSGGNLGNGNSDIYISSGATLNVNTSLTVDSVQETSNSNGGVIALGNGATLTIDGASKGNLYQNSISGGGGLTMAGSGDTSLALYGTQSYTGATTVTGGKITSGVALASTSYTVSDGTMETTADGVIANSAAISISGGEFIVGGNDTIGAVTATGGRLSVGSGKTAYLSGNSSIGSGAEAVGGTLQVNSGTTLTLNSNDVDNTSALTIASGGTIKGSFRTSGSLSVDGVLAPGNSTGISYVGATTFLGGGRYQWEIDTFGSGAVVGTNWDFLDISGNLTISATSGDQFIIDVISLLANNDTAGLASNFNDATNYTFAIATASGTISGYASNAFSINTTGFQNSFTGTWGTSLSNDGKSLNITYSATAIPEPSSAALTLIGLGVLALRRRHAARG